MDERLRFIARLLEGEKMAPLCREFGVIIGMALEINLDKPERAGKVGNELVGGEARMSTARRIR